MATVWSGASFHQWACGISKHGGRRMSSLASLPDSCAPGTEPLQPKPEETLGCPGNGKTTCHKNGPQGMARNHSPQVSGIQERAFEKLETLLVDQVAFLCTRLLQPPVNTGNGVWWLVTVLAQITFPQHHLPLGCSGIPSMWPWESIPRVHRIKNTPLWQHYPH